jgi:hypothetical protein
VINITIINTLACWALNLIGLLFILGGSLLELLGYKVNIDFTSQYAYITLVILMQPLQILWMKR